MRHLDSNNICSSVTGWFLLGLFIAGQTYSAEIRSFDFSAIRDTTSTVKNSAKIVQFIEETDADIASGLSYVVWRDLFGSIQDLRSSGTTLLTISDHPKLQQQIVQDYEYDVARVANEQQADFVIWGVVRQVEDAHLVWTYLAVADDKVGANLEVNVVLDGNHLIAQLPHRQFSFTPLQISSRQIGERLWYVRRHGATVYQSRDSSSDQLARLERFDHVLSRSVSGPWLELTGDDVPVGFVEMWPLDLAPKKAAWIGRSQLRSRPDASAEAVGAPSGPLSAEVSQVAYVGQSEIKWFELNVGEHTGWVPAETVVTSQVFPIGYLVTAMLRFQGGQYSRVVREVEQFIADGRESNNTIPAFANQLRGAAALMELAQSDDNLSLARSWFTAAIELTPYDPAAYRLRAISHATGTGDWAQVVADLEQAVTLDRRGAETRQLIVSILGAVRNAASSGRFESRRDGPSLRTIEEQLSTIDKLLLRPLTPAGSVP